MILLDTNVVSAVMAPLPPEAVMAWLDAQETDRLFLSAITVAEIGYGLRILPEGKRRQGFEHRILTFDLEAAYRYADLMARRRSIGRPMSVPDAEIAAIAPAHGMALATRNLTDFQDCGLALLDQFAYLKAGVDR